MDVKNSDEPIRKENLKRRDIYGILGGLHRLKSKNDPEIDTAEEVTLKKPIKTKWKNPTRLERAGKEQTVFNILQKLHQINVLKLRTEAGNQNIGENELDEIVEELKAKGHIFEPEPGVYEFVDI